MGWVAVVSHLHQTDALQQRTHQILERQDMLTEVVVRNEARYQELHEGTLHIAESEVGVGSRFEVDLPLDKATRPGNATQPRI